MAIVHAYQIDLDNNRRFVVDVPNWNTDFQPTPANIILTPIPINHGWLRPRHEPSGDFWEEGATNEELAARQDFLMDQQTKDAFREKVIILAESEQVLLNELSGPELEVFAFSVFKLIYKASRARRDAAIKAILVTNDPGSNAAAVKEAVNVYLNTCRIIDDTFVNIIKELVDVAAAG